MGIILNAYEEEKFSISTHTSLNEEIINQQSRILLFSEENIANSHEGNFESRFQGKSDPFYNCHGLTFACKRTSINDDKEIWKILTSEYFQIKSEKNVLIGDVILYLSGDEQHILHSGIVVRADQNALPDILIYSKVLKGKEIVHRPTKCTYFTQFNAIIKYYRITHENRFQRYS